MPGISISDFILAANIMNKGGITNRIFDFCGSIVGWIIRHYHPPVGSGLMIMSTVSKMKFSDVVKGVLPFWIPLFISLFIVTYVPQITMWLPNHVFGSWIPIS